MTEHRTKWPAIHILVDAEAHEWGGADSRYPVAEPLGPCTARAVHVVSRAAGCEVRGYLLATDGRLGLRTPPKDIAWPEMDDEVAKVLGATLVGGDGWLPLAGSRPSR